MKLEDLKQGDVFYDVTINKITKYEYLMLYPFHNPKNVKINSYHIILEKGLDEPIRIYYNRLENILNLKCFTFEEAKAKQIELLEDRIKTIKETQKIFESINVSKEVSDSVDEDAKIIDIFEIERIKLRNKYGSIVYKITNDEIIRELVINVSKKYKNNETIF